MRFQMMAQAGNRCVFVQVVSAPRLCVGDVFRRKLGKGGHGGGVVGLLLRGAQRFHGGVYSSEAFRAHVFGNFFQALGLGGVRRACYQDLSRCHVVVLQEYFARKLLKIALGELFAQVGEAFLVTQALNGAIVIVEPAGQRAHGVYHAVGVSEIAFAQQEFLVRESRFNELGVNAAFHQGSNVVRYKLVERG